MVIWNPSPGRGPPTRSRPNASLMPTDPIWPSSPSSRDSQRYVTNERCPFGSAMSGQNTSPRGNGTYPSCSLSGMPTAHRVDAGSCAIEGCCALAAPEMPLRTEKMHDVKAAVRRSRMFVPPAVSLGRASGGNRGISGWGQVAAGVRCLSSLRADALPRDPDAHGKRHADHAEHEHEAGPHGL